MTGRPIVFLDTETTGLSPKLHDVWEIGLIRRVLRSDGAHHVDTEFLFRVKPELACADPDALRVCRYYARTASMTAPRPREVWDLTEPNAERHWSDPAALAPRLAELLDGVTIWGIVPDFDARHLSSFLRRHDQCATWHYQLQDVSTLGAGFLAGRDVTIPEDADSETISNLLLVDPPDQDIPQGRHTALGDARWARDMYDAVVHTSRPKLAADES